MNWEELKRSAEQTSDLQKAGELWTLALKEAEKMQQDLRIAVALDGLGMTSFCQNKLPVALNYYDRALKLRVKSLGTQQHILVAHSYNNIASIYVEQGELLLAQKNLTASLVILLICSSIEDRLTRQTMRSLLFVFQRRHSRFEHAEAAEWSKLAKAISTSSSSEREYPICEICRRGYMGLQCLRCTLTGIKSPTYVDLDS